jgi:uncharacterized protein
VTLANLTPTGRADRLLLALLLALTFPFAARAEKVEQLKPQGYVNDFAGVLNEQAKAQLTALCAEVDQKTKAQIAVVTIHSLEGVPVEDFGIRLATRWGVGHKGDNRGVLILLAIDDRKYRTEVGYGLEPILPDGKVGGFGREMVPGLRARDYSGALLHLTSEIAAVIAQDRGVALGSLPREQPTAPREGPGVPRLSPAVGLLLLVLLFGGAGLLFAIIGGLAGRRSRRGAWWAGPWISGGRSWGGGGFGGGGFGGFGGGGFGGGGASGGW